MSTVPLPLKPGGNVNEKSPRVIVDGDGRRGLDSTSAVLATFTALTMPCAACGLPSLVAGMRHTTA